MQQHFKFSEKTKFRQTAWSRKQFQHETCVSDEILLRIEAYGSLLEKWQKKINLVGGNTVVDLWNRHMFDSAQLIPLLPRLDCSTLDLGSGAGFPGLILAIMGNTNVTLVESDGRKCAFLREVIRSTNVSSSVRVENCRIEDLSIYQVDVITSRALAPLEKLLELAEPFFRKDTICLFLKGKKVDEELIQAEKSWEMLVSKIQSKSSLTGVILKLEDVKRR